MLDFSLLVDPERVTDQEEGFRADWESEFNDNIAIEHNEQGMADFLECDHTHGQVRGNLKQRVAEWEALEATKPVLEVIKVTPYTFQRARLYIIALMRKCGT